MQGLKIFGETSVYSINHGHRRQKSHALKCLSRHRVDTRDKPTQIVRNWLITGGEAAWISSINQHWYSGCIYTIDWLALEIASYSFKSTSDSTKYTAHVKEHLFCSNVPYNIVPTYPAYREYHSWRNISWILRHMLVRIVFWLIVKWAHCGVNNNWDMQIWLKG